jgi:hypothetical protein
MDINGDAVCLLGDRNLILNIIYEKEVHALDT